MQEKEIRLDDRKWKHMTRRMPKSKRTDRCVKKERVKKKLQCDYGGQRKIKILMTAQDQKIKGG